MSTVNYATPILYVNMGGEMLYVLQQRLQTQKISPDKTIQVLHEVIETLLNPKQLERIWSGPDAAGLAQLRPILERVVLSSIMRLDANSMAKLFDLMIMMVKYQLSAVSGPRELVLSTLNHLDAVRDMALTEPSLGRAVDACHRLVVDTYGQMTHQQVWDIRNECLRELQQHNVRVSVLLRLGAQNQDATFNRPLQSYDEKYREREPLLRGLKLLDEGASGSGGQFGLRGDRATLLGKNAYCASTSCALTASASQQAFLARSNKAMRQELETLATQLGKEETAPARPFSLQLHVRRDIEPPEANANRVDEDAARRRRLSTSDGDGDGDVDDNERYRSIDQYQSNLIDDVNAQFEDGNNENENTARASEPADLINFLDIM